MLSLLTRVPYSDTRLLAAYLEIYLVEFKEEDMHLVLPRTFVPSLLLQNQRRGGKSAIISYLFAPWY